MIDRNEFTKSELKEFGSKKFKDNKDRTLTKKDFIKRLSGATGLNLKTTRIITDAVIGELRSCMLDGLCVRFEGFGTFGTYLRRKRIVNNPIVGGIVTMPDKLSVKFKPSKNFNKKVTENFEKEITRNE